MISVNLPLLRLHIIMFIICLVIVSNIIVNTANSQSKNIKRPYIIQNDNNQFKVETVYRGINVSSNMAFLGPDDILVLEKNQGIVKRIVNGTLLEKPLLDVNVFHADGLAGIAISSENSGRKYVFLQYTQSAQGYGGDVNRTNEEEVIKTIGYTKECNCLYRYEFVNDTLVNPKLLLKLPAGPGGQHHGGEIMIGPDKNLYIVVGDIEGNEDDATKTKAQNFENGTAPDGRAGILRVTQEGEPVGNGILGNTYPLNLYYAYGIRNSFGIDFDPITGKLWDTENGPNYGDEINLVEPGFNSGSSDVYGMSSQDDEYDPNKLVDFNGRGKYSDPEFDWDVTVAPTALKFLNSTKYGKEYENDLFVGGWKDGYLYRFDLNEDRTEVKLEGPLEDKIADPPDLKQVVFGADFGGITDIQIGPDGYIYVVSNRAIFKVVPVSD